MNITHAKIISTILLLMLFIPCLHAQDKRKVKGAAVPIQTIFINSRIDLNQFYKIKDTNGRPHTTVFNWYTFDNQELTKTSLVKGKKGVFVADETLSGQTIVCKMKNPAIIDNDIFAYFFKDPNAGFIKDPFKTANGRWYILDPVNLQSYQKKGATINWYNLDKRSDDDPGEVVVSVDDFITNNNGIFSIDTFLTRLWVRCYVNTKKAKDSFDIFLSPTPEESKTNTFAPLERELLYSDDDAINYYSTYFAHKKHEFMPQLGAGIFPLVYDIDQSSQKIDLGGSLSIRYNYRLSPKFLIGTGITANFFNEKITMDDYTGTGQYKFANGTPFTFTYKYKDYEESAKAVIMDIPLLVTFEQVARFTAWRFSIGAKCLIPIVANYNSNGTLTTSASTGNIFPTDGFVLNQNIDNGKQKLKMTPGVALSAEIGVKFVNNIFVSLFVDYGLTDMRKDKDLPLVQWNEGTIDTFTYESAASSLSKSLKTLDAGVKIGFCF